MNDFIKKIVFFDDDLLFEQKLHNGLCLLGVGVTSTIAVIDLLYKMYIESAIIGLLAIGLGILFLFARFKKLYYFTGIYLLTMLLLTSSYFRGYGIHGTMLYYLIAFLSLALAYNPIKSHRKIFVFHLLFFAVMFTLERYLPGIIYNPYHSEGVLYNNLVIAVFMNLIMIYITINFLRKSYDKERRKNKLQEDLLKKNHEQKSMFFINLSHEIKTPLTLLENYLDKYIARKGEDHELIVMRQNIQKMRRDIVDYLNFENLERGNLSFDNSDVILLDAIIIDKVQLFKVYAENRGVELYYTIEPEVFVKFNVQGIDQILNNLLENAVKYTPSDGKISVVLSRDSDVAILQVQNTGTIISSEQLPHLFEPFYQMSHDKLNAQGIGMGLYTVKKILDTIGGEIKVSSSQESGVNFTVMFPLSSERLAPIQHIERVTHLNIHHVTPKALDSSFLKDRSCILIVEDNNDLLNYLSEELGETYNVFVAENGMAALAKLEHIPVPDLILSDIMMDKMDGYEFLERTLNDEKLRHIPFLFLTAKNKAEEKLAGLDKGVLDFITKPFSIEEIRLKVKSIINQKSRISDAAIVEMKKQLTENYFLNNRQHQDEVFAANVRKYLITPREMEIVVKIQDGLTYEDIGLKLHISENTVTRHVQNIYKKTQSTTKIDMLRKIFA